MSRRKSNSNTETLWVEKYRPQTINDCIMLDDMSAQFGAYIEKGDFPNMLLTGGAGCGKTTAAIALCNDLGYDYLLVNASKDGNIDTLRTKIQNYASSRSIGGKRKCVILDEADHLNQQSTQPALRAFIEDHSRNCRFIFTCNFPKKIIDPLLSRLAVHEFSFSKRESVTMAKHFMARISHILDNEGVEYHKKDVAVLIKKYTPDYRKVINQAQMLSSTGTLDASRFNEDKESLEVLANHIKNREFTDCRKWIVDHGQYNFTEIMKVRIFLEDMIKKESLPDLFVILNEFDVKAASATDLEVHIMAFISTLMFDLEYV